MWLLLRSPLSRPSVRQLLLLLLLSQLRVAAEQKQHNAV
jgi:hypothetical protein